MQNDNELKQMLLKSPRARQIIEDEKISGDIMAGLLEKVLQQNLSPGRTMIIIMRVLATFGAASVIGLSKDGARSLLRRTAVDVVRLSQIQATNVPGGNPVASEEEPGTFLFNDEAKAGWETLQAAELALVAAGADAGLIKKVTDLAVLVKPDDFSDQVETLKKKLAEGKY